LSDGRQAKAVLPALRCHSESVLGALSALREAVLGMAPRWLGSASLRGSSRGNLTLHSGLRVSLGRWFRSSLATS